eukprot:365994-Chlamydomonas_euryale.AAC.6
MVNHSSQIVPPGRPHEGGSYTWWPICLTPVTCMGLHGCTTISTCMHIHTCVQDTATNAQATAGARAGPTLAVQLWAARSLHLPGTPSVILLEISTPHPLAPTFCRAVGPAVTHTPRRASACVLNRG